MSEWEDLNTPFKETFNNVIKDFSNFEVIEVPEDTKESIKSGFFVRSTPAFVVTTDDNQVLAKESGVVHENHMREIINNVING